MQLYYLVINQQLVCACMCHPIFAFISLIMFFWCTQFCNYYGAFDLWLYSLFDTNVILVRFIVRVWLQNYEILHYRGFREEFFCSQLSSFSLSNQHGRVMSLETGDSFWFARLANCIHCDAHSDLRLCWRQILVKGDQHARIDRQGQVVEEVVVFAAEERFHVGCRDNCSQQTRQRYVWEEEFVRVGWVETQKPFAHMD